MSKEESIGCVFGGTDSRGISEPASSDISQCAVECGERRPYATPLIHKRKSMIVLGIHDGHDCSAALMREGQVIAAAQEERFSSLKADSGYPARSIEFCLDFAGLSPGDIDVVGLSSFKLNPVLNYLKRYASFSVEDWIDEQQLYWKPRLFDAREPNYFDIFKDRNLHFDERYDYDGLLQRYNDEADFRVFLDRRVDYIIRTLGVDHEKIVVTGHEEDHQCYALFTSPFRGHPVLVLTAEGMGDRFNGTVSVYKDGEIKSLCTMTENFLGVIFRHITLMLGMKPFQHEYKVMGLAPYASAFETEKAYAKLKDILCVDGMQIRFRNRPADLFFTIRDALLGCRFDGIAAAVQLLLEETLCEWVTNCVDATGVSHVVMAGGLAQNIKAMKRVSELDCVTDIFIAPAAGDTSNSIGCAYRVNYESSTKSYSQHEHIDSLENPYLGPAFTATEIGAAIREEPRLAESSGEFEIIRDVDNRALAEHLARGGVLGLMRGRMEFGLRSLGNRSIVADPSRPGVIGEINEMIKFRDFWMPFAPSILAERADDYIQNPKDLSGKFMTMAFESVEENREQIAGGLHPADKTLRPQLVEANDNPRYHHLLREFEKRTGIGVLLNTSFNLHGLPIVLGPKEAIYTLLHSALDGIVMEDVLVLRKAPA